MPMFLVPAIEALGAWMLGAGAGVLGAATMMYAGTIATAALLIGGLAYSSLKARQAKEEARNQYNAAQVDRMVNVTSAIAPRELVLGRVRKGGSVFYRASTGANQKDLYLAIALAGHEIDAVEAIYLNDVLATLDVSGNVTNEPYATSGKISASGNTGAGTTLTLPAGYVVGSAVGTKTTGTGQDLMILPVVVTVVGLVATAAEVGTDINYQYSESTSHLQITTHLGAAGQTADAGLMAAFPADWTAANVVQGVAYLVARLTYSETAFPTGVPNITAVIRGAKLYDPRTALTVWSENPALMARHVYAHARFGKAAVTSTEDARFIAAANACDTATVYTVAGVAQASRALYTAALVAPFGTPARSLLDDLSQAMGGSWAFAGGEIYLKPGVYTAPVMALADADLAVVKRDGASESQSAIGIAVHKERAQQFNTIKISIWDAAQDYKQVALTPLVGTALVARDGVELVQEASFPAIGYAPQALHVAGIMMRDARDPLVVELPFKLRAYPLELFDTVTLTLARYGWSAKQFMVLGRAWNMDGAIVLTLKETAAAITQMDADFLPQGWAPNTNLPKPWQVAAVTGLAAVSGPSELLLQNDGTSVSRMRVSWTQVADAAVVQAGQVEVQYRRADSTGAWTSIVVPGNETQAMATGVQDDTIIILRARAKTSAAVGDWCANISCAINGKQTPPENVAGLSATSSSAGIKLAWTPCVALDYAKTIIREGASWAAGAELFAGAASNWLWVRPASATYTFWAKHVDASGNQSAAAASVILAYTSESMAGPAGAEGSKGVTVSCFKWSNTGAGSPSQAFTYTWSNGAISAFPVGWSAAAPASPGTGYTLYMLNLTLVALASAATTAANWSAASINSIGYTETGAIGVQGDGHRIAYAKSTIAAPSGTATSTGTASLPATGSFGLTAAVFYTSPPSLSAGEYLYQTDGIFVVATDTITWATPYLSNLKVGSLSAISANLGVVDIASGGNLKSGKSSAADTTAGFFLGNDAGTPKFALGNATYSFSWNGSALVVVGDIIATGNIIADAVTVAQGVAITSLAQASWSTTPLYGTACATSSAANYTASKVIIISAIEHTLPTATYGTDNVWVGSISYYLYRLVDGVGWTLLLTTKNPNFTYIDTPNATAYYKIVPILTNDGYSATGGYVNSGNMFVLGAKK